MTVVEAGDPAVFAKGPTSRALDIAVGSRLSPEGIRQFHQWMVTGRTSTSRTNSLSVVAKLPGEENARLVARALDSDTPVRRLCLASDISRLTRTPWTDALRFAEDVSAFPEPRKLAARLTKEAVNPRDSESRWCASYMLTQLVPVLGR
ncbi:hypothetical protein [Actinokineospora bangkokensis]|uniref:hypothetical protein n=1 Tax=Actinokineospora bangkokensis TaxID=1193682 RepID=UPI001177F8D7|nr:hypothetical protein [Actinokineospora bangkokensis]